MLLNLPVILSEKADCWITTVELEQAQGHGARFKPVVNNFSTRKSPGIRACKARGPHSKLAKGSLDLVYT